MEQTLMKEKPILPLVLSMSLPMVFSMLVNSLYNIIDSYFVARISEDAMTALSLVYPMQNLILAVTLGFSIGINAVISYYLGAGKNEDANCTATLGLAFNVLHGLVLMVVCVGSSPVFLRLFTTENKVIDLGIRYSRIVFSFSVIIAVGMTMEKIVQSVGKMMVTMISMLCGCVTNILLDPVLIFGLGPFPEMGIEGAALATGIGQTVNLVVYLFVFFRRFSVQIRWSYLVFNKEITKKLYSIGIPATLNLALPSLLISSLNVILSAFSPIYVVVLGVYYKLQTFLYLPANGIVQGIRPLIGYNYGAREYKRVQGIYRTALSLTAGIMVFGTGLCWAVPEQLIALFTSNQETIHAGVFALNMISVGFVASTLSVISSGALEGLGKGGASFMISLFRYGIITIPAAFLCSLFFGAEGVWFGFSISEWLTAAISFTIYRKAFKED